MAAICAMQIGTEDTKDVFRVEWDGEDWIYKDMSKPAEMGEMLGEMLWEVLQMESKLEFQKSETTIQAKLLTERPPYNMRYNHWVAKSIMEHHVERGLGKVVLPIAKEDLLILT